MKAEYRHTQFGAATVIMLLIVGLLLVPFIVSMFADGKVVSAAITIGLLLLVLAMFYSLTIKISEGKLTFWMGIGLIRKTVALSEIHAADTVHSPWYYLWGIKSIPGGWYYAVAPGSAVEIVLKDEKVVRLGTNQPKELKEAIDEALATVDQL